MINLKNLMKLFVYFGISIAKTGVYIYIFLTYCNVRKSTVFFNPSIPNLISLIVISVDNSGVAEGRKGGGLPLIIIVNNSINKKT